MPPWRSEPWPRVAIRTPMATNTRLPRKYAHCLRPLTRWSLACGGEWLRRPVLGKSGRRARHQAGVDQRERLAEQLGPDRSGLGELVDRQAADDGHHHAREVIRRHREARCAEVACAGLERAGQHRPELRLALGIASSNLRVADREGPVLAFEEHGVALLGQPAREL